MLVTALINRFLKFEFVISKWYLIYQKRFLISRIKVDYLYQQIEFLILEYHFLISKYRLIFWYQKNRFSISENKSYIKWMNALCDATFVIWKKLCFKPVKNNKVCLVLYPISFWQVRIHIQRLALLAKRSLWILRRS